MMKEKLKQEQCIVIEPNIKINVIEELKINDKKVSSSFIIQDITISIAVNLNLSRG